METVQKGFWLVMAAELLLPLTVGDGGGGGRMGASGQREGTPLVIIMNDNMGLAVIVAMNSITTYGGSHCAWTMRKWVESSHNTIDTLMRLHVAYQATNTGTVRHNYIIIASG